MKPVALVHASFNTADRTAYAVQVVLAPHFYCPGVSGATKCFAGQTQWTALDNTVGYLTRSPGFCTGGKCKV